MPEFLLSSQISSPRLNCLTYTIFLPARLFSPLIKISSRSPPPILFQSPTLYETAFLHSSPPTLTDSSYHCFLLGLLFLILTECCAPLFLLSVFLVFSNSFFTSTNLFLIFSFLPFLLTVRIDAQRQIWQSCRLLFSVYTFVNTHIHTYESIWQFIKLFAYTRINTYTYIYLLSSIYIIIILNGFYLSLRLEFFCILTTDPVVARDRVLLYRSYSSSYFLRPNTPVVRSFTSPSSNHQYLRTDLCCPWNSFQCVNQYRCNSHSPGEDPCILIFSCIFIPRLAGTVASTLVSLLAYFSAILTSAWNICHDLLIPHHMAYFYFHEHLLFLFFSFWLDQKFVLFWSLNGIRRV